MRVASARCAVARLLVPEGFVGNAGGMQGFQHSPWCGHRGDPQLQGDGARPSLGAQCSRGEAALV